MYIYIGNGGAQSQYESLNNLFKNHSTSSRFKTTQTIELGPHKTAKDAIETILRSSPHKDHIIAIRHDRVSLLKPKTVSYQPVTNMVDVRGRHCLLLKQVIPGDNASLRFPGVKFESGEDAKLAKTEKILTKLLSGDTRYQLVEIPPETEKSQVINRLHDDDREVGVEVLEDYYLSKFFASFKKVALVAGAVVFITNRLFHHYRG